MPDRQQFEEAALFVRLFLCARDDRPVYRGVRRIGDTRDLWSVPAKRSGDGALTVPDLQPSEPKRGRASLCPRTPKFPVPQLSVATVSSVTHAHGFVFANTGMHRRVISRHIQLH